MIMDIYSLLGQILVGKVSILLAFGEYLAFMIVDILFVISFLEYLILIAILINQFRQ